MTRIAKLYERLLDNPRPIISFRDFETLLRAFGFELARTTGSHRHYSHPRVAAILTVQPRGKDAVPYQVKRLLAVIAEYDLHMVP